MVPVHYASLRNVCLTNTVASPDIPCGQTVCCHGNGIGLCGFNIRVVYSRDLVENGSGDYLEEVKHLGTGHHGQGLQVRGHCNTQTHTDIYTESSQLPAQTHTEIIYTERHHRHTQR